MESKPETPKVELPEDPALLQRVYKDYLDNPVFEQAIQNYKEQIIEAWIKTGPKATEERELLWYSYQTLLSVKGNVLRSFTKASNDVHLQLIQRKE